MYCYYEDSTILDPEERKRKRMCIKLCIRDVSEMFSIMVKTKWILTECRELDNDQPF